MVLDEWVVDAAATHHLSLPELITRLSHHPQVDSFLALWQQCLSVSDRTDKMELYRQLCAQVTDPGRVLWPDDHTVFELHSVTPASLEQIEVALNFWAELTTGV